MPGAHAADLMYGTLVVSKSFCVPLRRSTWLPHLGYYLEYLSWSVRSRRPRWQRPAPHTWSQIPRTSRIRTMAPDTSKVAATSDGVARPMLSDGRERAAR